MWTLLLVSFGFFVGFVLAIEWLLALSPIDRGARQRSLTRAERRALDKAELREIYEDQLGHQARSTRGW
jgi:hypothetical protein